MIFDILTAIQSTLGAQCHLDTVPQSDVHHTKNGIYLSLFNINEKASLQNINLHLQNTDRASQIDKPPLRLDLYVIIAVCNTSYNESLKTLDEMMQTFATISYHKIPTKGIEFTMQLANLTFEQNAMLWQSLFNGKYSFLVYKVSAIKQFDFQ